MKTVKTNLFALAAGVLISPAVMAADIATNSDTTTWSNELLSTAASDDIADGGVLEVILDAEYKEDDVITLSFTGAALDPDSACDTATSEGLGLAILQLGRLSATDSEAVYRVTSVDTAGGNSTIGGTIDFDDCVDSLEFNAQAVASAGSVVVSYNAETGTGLPLDTTGGDDRSVEYIATDDHYSATVLPKFNAIVDVEQDREGFFPPLGDQFDEATVVLDEDFAMEVPTFVNNDFVWEGDFSWIVDGDDMTAGIQPMFPGVVDSDCLADDTDAEITASSITYSCPDLDATDETLTLDPSVQGPDDFTVLPATSYTALLTVNFTGYGGADGSHTFTLDGGAWRLNGFQAELSYTPFGTGISQVIYVANRGPQAGDITVDYVDQDGNSETLGVVATLQPTSTLSLGNIIKNALPPNLRSFGRLALTITANVPSCDAQVNAQYNVGGNSRAYTSARDNCDEWPGSF